MKGLHIFENEYFAFRYLFHTYHTGHIVEGPCTVLVKDDVLALRAMEFQPSQWISLGMPEALQFTASKS